MLILACCVVLLVLLYNVSCYLYDSVNVVIRNKCALSKVRKNKFGHIYV